MPVKNLVIKAADGVDVSQAFLSLAAGRQNQAEKKSEQSLVSLL